MLPSERRSVGLVGIIFALRMLGLFMILPVFSLHGAEYEGATPMLIGLAIGAYGLMQSLLQIPFGLLSDRIGRRPLILFGLLLFAAGGLVAANAEHIYGVIAGRALQGAGAIASVLMALLTDNTRTSQRTRAMAMLGGSIGLAFAISLVLGPVFAEWFGLPGMFWLTSAMALLGMLCLFWVPHQVSGVKLKVRQAKTSLRLAKVLGNVEMMRINFGIFSLHLVMTACFIALPLLLERLGVDQVRHGLVYLPILFLSFIVMLPLMIIAEKKRQVKAVFLGAILIVLAGLLVMELGSRNLYLLVFGVFVFFTGFNLLEAMLPSIMSKIAPAGAKGTVMGFYSSSQFMGAFLGGVAGGMVYGNYGLELVFIAAAVVTLAWFTVAMGMRNPRFLKDRVINLDGVDNERMEEIAERFMTVSGVHEATVLMEDKVAFLKVDDDKVDEKALNMVFA